MSRHRLVLSLAVISASFLFTALKVAAQPQGQSPDQKPRKVKQEPNRVFKDWPNEVAAIITEAEINAYKKLKTDDEREQFIATFWRRRDTDPDTEENEYKDQYYERIAYANEHFASGKPGWLTDRGRIYLKWGKPDEIEAHPAGGQYQRADYEGEGSTAVYPFERWFYRNLPGVRSGVEIEFVDPSGTGEYRIARNPFEKEAGPFSANGANPGNTGDFGMRNYRREQDSPFNVIELIKDLDAPPPLPLNANGINRRDTPVAEDNVLSVEIKPAFFPQSDGRVVTAFAIQADNRELVFRDSGGLQVARLNIFGKVLNVTDRKVGAFEDSVTTTATAAELAEARDRKSIYGRAVILTPGKYRIDVMVRDIASGARGFEQLAFTVPRLEPTKLQTSSIVLAAKLESLKDQVGGGQFAIGTMKVVPNLSAVYHRGEPVGIYLQVYNVGTDQTTLLPAVDVEYVLLKDGQELKRQAEDWRGLSDAGQRVTLARLIASEGLAPGKYEIQVRIRDHVTSQELAPSVEFTVVP
jgi:GWxTD domain-containing protein